MAFKLSLSKFKKVSSDKDHTVMRDGKGNEIKVAHKMLTPALKEQLDGLPVHLAEGGMVKKPKYADGGEVQDPSAPVTINIGAQPPAQLASPQMPPPAQPQQFTMPSPTGQYDAPPAPESQMIPGAVQAPPPAMAPQTPQAAPQAPEMPPSTPTPQAAPERAPSASASAEMPQPKQGLDIMDAYNTGTRGINEQAKAEAAAAAEHAAALQQSIKWSQDFETTTKQQMADTSKEIQAAMDDYKNQHITPQKLFANSSTAGKILGVIGLTLGGGGAAAAHQDPALMKVLTQEIDRDVAAQQAEMGKKQNLIGAYQHKFQNVKDAADMTKLVHAGIVAQQIDQAAVKQGGPLARARADQAIAALQKEYYPLKLQLDMRRAVMGFANDPSGQGNNGTGRIDAMLNNLRVVNPEMAKEMESRYVPGVGLGSVPIPSDARTAIVAKSNLVNATRNLQKWVKTNGGSPDPKVRAEGEALALELQQIYRQGVGASTSSEEQETIGKIIHDNPASFLHKFNTDPKLKALEHSMVSSLNNTKQNYGLPIEQPKIETKIVNGITYMRGPDGKAVRVK